MSDLWASIGLVLVITLIGAFFVAAEIALVSLRDSQIERLSSQGRRGRWLAALTAQPNRFLAAVQVGVTLVAVISAAFGEARITPYLEPTFEAWGMSPAGADILAFFVVALAIAYVTIVFGELVPKRLGLQRPETVALTLAGPLEVVAKVMRPVIWFLSLSTNAVVRLLGGNPQAAREQITGEELRDIVAAHEDLTAEERALIDDVFDAGDRELKEVMVPRTETAFLDASMSIADAAQEVASAPHSRYPVIRGSADNVVGVVHIREILHPGAADSRRTVGDLARQVVFFPGTKEVIPALTEMRRQRQHLAIVVDEYGGTAGIVSLEDLVEELIGDIRDEYDEVTSAGPAEVDGLLNLEDFHDATGVTLPDGPYETAAGFVISRLGALPEVDAYVDVDGHRLSVSQLDGRRIARLRVTPLPAPPVPLPE